MTYLVGRRRLVARVLFEIPHFENKSCSKQEVLHEAIKNSVDAHRDKLTARFKEAVAKSMLHKYLFFLSLLLNKCR
jgi:hypothetical protein